MNTAKSDKFIMNNEQHAISSAIFAGYGCGDDDTIIAVCEAGGASSSDKNSLELLNSQYIASQLSFSLESPKNKTTDGSFLCGSSSTNSAQKLSINNLQTLFSCNKIEDYHFDVPPEAPIFTPTEAEFKNPFGYINKIRPIAEKYGICKIKPPTEWQPSFTVDVDKLRFTPIIQHINELEALTRVKLNFINEIAKFWKLQGSSLNIPMVERKPLDLYSLHRIVQEEGGLEQTINNRKWLKIALRMGYPEEKSIGTILKKYYERILYPFDVYTSGQIHAFDIKLEVQENDEHDCTPDCIESRQQVSPPQETTVRRSKRLAQKKKFVPIKIKSELIEPPIIKSPVKVDVKSKMNHRNMSVNIKSEIKQKISTDPFAKYICHICNRGDVGKSIILCDGCDDSYHTFCLIPALSDIPKKDWHCPKCVVEEVNKPIEEFGFEQAQRKYTLQQFREMADQFKTDYFNMPAQTVPTELVEREFWRIVSSINEDVIVAYGADLHTMDHGSGFPIKSSKYLLPEDQKYAESNWNLNNLPLLEDSILGHINADISGIKVPWMYAGMCFATFCWHNEDHWSYSINYLHVGEPKTWYGVPGTKAELFEETIKSSAPELFHSQPDLLHQLVTIMNPNILVNAGVPVYRTDQCAGEFVITFPRAYHAGFNQGYNFAEAVNFAPADWMQMGRECINHYSTLRRFCVFSHDEVVCKIALDPDRLNFGIATACYLDMAEMMDSEKKLRKSLLEWGVTKSVRTLFELIPDDERYCDICKTTCFLSAVGCRCCKSIVCLHHYSELCKCAPVRHILQYRYTLEELLLMSCKLKVKVKSFKNWLKRIRDVLNPNTSSTIILDEIRKFAQEAKDCKFPYSILSERLNSVVIEVKKFITVIQQLDINKIRTRTRNSCENTNYNLIMEELDIFVEQNDNLSCVIKQFQEMSKEVIDYAANVLETPINEVRNEELEYAIDKVSSLKEKLAQVSWYYEVRQIRESADKVPLVVLKRLIDEGMKITPNYIIERELDDLYSIIASVMGLARGWKDRTLRIFLHKNSQFTLMEVLLPRIEPVMFNSLCKKFTEEMTSVQMVVAFKEAEEKEIRGMVELRKTNSSKNPETDLYCICKRKFSGIMYYCQLCNNWFHAQCVPPPKNTVSQRPLNSTTSNFGINIPIINRNKDIELKYLCQSCLRSRRPRLDTIRSLIPVKRLPIRIPEVEALQCLIERAMNWQDRVRQLLTSEEITKAIAKLSELNNNIINSTQCTNIIQPPTIATSTFINNKQKSSLRSRIKDSGTATETSSNENDFKPHHQSQQQPQDQQQQLPQQELSPQSTPLLLSSPLPLPLLPNSSNILSSTENRAPSLTNIEDVYPDFSLTPISSGESTQPNGKFEQIENSKPPLIAISSAVVNNLEVLMMEGDLLEVSLDETNLIWRLLNATKPNYTDLSYIYHKYNINPVTTIQPGYQQCTIKKRKSNYYLKQQEKLTKLSDIGVMPVISTTVNTSVYPTLQNIQDVLPNTPSPSPSQSPTSTNPNQSAGTIVPNSISQSPIIVSGSKSCGIKSKSKFKNYMKMNSTKPGWKLKLRQPFATSAQKNNMKRKLNKNQKKKVKLAIYTTPLPSGDILNNVDHHNSLEVNYDDCCAVSCVRPSGGIVDWVQCDGGCNKWFHMLCVGLNKNQIKRDDDFICHKCKNKNPHSDDITPITNNASSPPSILAVSRTRDIGQHHWSSAPLSLPPTTTGNTITPSEMHEVQEQDQNEQNI